MTTSARVDPPNLSAAIFDGALWCPRCPDGGNLHHGAVVVQQRTSEDGPGVTVEVFGCGRTTISPHTPAGQIPGRRDYLEILFYCEQCSDREGSTPADLALCIQQHKGDTLVWWEVRA